MYKKIISVLLTITFLSTNASYAIQVSRVENFRLRVPVTAKYGQQRVGEAVSQVAAAINTGSQKTALASNHAIDPEQGNDRGKGKVAYFFGTDLSGNNLTEGDVRMKKSLGGKGANLAQMARLSYILDGISQPIMVPQGFTITVEEALKYLKKGDKELSREVLDAIETNLQKLEAARGRKLGDNKKPLLYSVRSGAAISMPGMMDTVLNLGLNDETVIALAEEFKNERFAWDSYRRLITMFGDVVLGLGKEGFDEIFEAKKKEKKALQDIDLSADDLKDIVKRYKEYIASKNMKFPQDLKTQLYLAIKAVFDSSNTQRAIDYRRIYKISPDIVSAVNVQAMVFGNLNNNSATGVAFTRNPSTGNNVFYGEWLPNAQGEDVVAGIRTPMPLNKAGKEEFLKLHPEYKSRENDIVVTLEQELPGPYRELVAIYHTLENEYRDMQDIEFTIQDGVLYLLQTRDGKRTAQAALKIAMDLVKEGMIGEKEAIMRISPEQIDTLLHKNFDPADQTKAKAEDRIIAKGLNASPGAAKGVVVFDSKEAEEMKKMNPEMSIVLVRKETSPDDIGGMEAATGILTGRGGITSHAAVVARGMGKTAVVGAEDITVYEGKGYFIAKGQRINKGDTISLDGTTGEVFLGELKTIDSIIIRGKRGEQLTPEETATYNRFNEFFAWVDKYRGQIRTNAETPFDVTAAIKYFNADGIGLARTEHMFRGEERLIRFQKMILTGDVRYLSELSEYQKEDFKEIFRLIDGKPMTIRLLDPPLHEFLPRHETEKGMQNLEKLARELDLPKEKVIESIEKLKEENPMAGFRGDRLGMVQEDITKMQVRAIFNAYKESKEQGIKLSPVEIMIPLIGVAEEFIVFEDMIKKIAREEFGFERGKGKDYFIGTMIETPSAALQSDKIARHADFFSFGTNDLTQFTFKFSRDDAGNIVIPEYVSQALSILRIDPFATIDEYVGELVAISVSLARSVKPDIKISLCGEHGGDPESIKKYIIPAGLNISSCSPFRVLGAKLASAQRYIQYGIEGKNVELYDLAKIKAEPVDIKPVSVFLSEESAGKHTKDTMRELIITEVIERQRLRELAVQENRPKELWSQYDLAKTLKDEYAVKLESLMKSEFEEALDKDNSAFIRLFYQDFGALFKGITDEEIEILAQRLNLDAETMSSIIGKLCDETNPAMGRLGVRQALTGHSGIFRAQLRAIFSAMIENPSYNPRIIVPLIVDSQEFKLINDMAGELAKEKGIDRARFSLGAAIETPRAVLDSSSIAKIADFIIFDTMGLTEAVLSTTRKDAESFLPTFIEKGIYGEHPFKTMPQNVTQFVEIGVRRSLEGNPKTPIYYFGENAKQATGLAASETPGASRLSAQGSTLASNADITRKQQVDSLDQIIAVSADSVIANKEGFETWIAQLPENNAVVIIAASEEYDDVKGYENIAYIKVIGKDIDQEYGLKLIELFNVYGNPNLFGGFKLGTPVSLDEYKTVVGQIASGV